MSGDYVNAFVNNGLRGAGMVLNYVENQDRIRSTEKMAAQDLSLRDTMHQRDTAFNNRKLDEEVQLKRDELAQVEKQFQETYGLEDRKTAAFEKTQASLRGVYAANARHMDAETAHQTEVTRQTNLDYDGQLAARTSDAVNAAVYSRHGGNYSLAAQDLQFVSHVAQMVSANPMMVRYFAGRDLKDPHVVYDEKSDMMMIEGTNSKGEQTAMTTDGKPLREGDRAVWFSREEFIAAAAKMGEPYGAFSPDAANLFTREIGADGIEGKDLGGILDTLSEQTRVQSGLEGAEEAASGIVPPGDEALSRLRPDSPEALQIKDLRSQILEAQQKRNAKLPDLLTDKYGGLRAPTTWENFTRILGNPNPAIVAAWNEERLRGQLADLEAEVLATHPAPESMPAPAPTTAPEAISAQQAGPPEPTPLTAPALNEKGLRALGVAGMTGGDVNATTRVAQGLGAHAPNPAEHEQQLIAQGITGLDGRARRGGKGLPEAPEIPVSTATLRRIDMAIRAEFLPTNVENGKDTAAKNAGKAALKASKKDIAAMMRNPETIAIARTAIRDLPFNPNEWTDAQMREVVQIMQNIIPMGSSLVALGDVPDRRNEEEPAPRSLRSEFR